MNDWIESFHFSIGGAVLLLSIMGLWFAFIIPGIDRWRKRFFMCYFLIFMLCCLSGFVEMVFQRSNVSGAGFYFLLFWETQLLILPLPMLTIFLLHCCEENMRSSRLLHIVLGLWAVSFLVLACSSFIEGFIYITPENQYFRGPLFPVFLLPVVAIPLLNAVETIRHRKRFSRKVFLALLIAILPTTFTLIAHLFTDVYPLLEISYVLSALSMYSFILSDQIEQDRRHQQEIAEQQRENARHQQEIAEQQRENARHQQEIAEQQQKIARQQREIAHERASVMVLQMRPHFIYNTLMSIYSLCRLDPQKARQITMDFTNYLRRNFNAVASDSAIPFSTELEHTRAYLAVEQAQFDEMLIVDWDTKYTHFRLPPLTLQPIVENAVKHGMDPDSEPLHISIRTRHAVSGAEITVEDNGCGFDPADDDEPGIALKNIRQRLEIMCGGSMTIEPGEGGGTVVTVLIPDRTEE